MKHSEEVANKQGMSPNRSIRSTTESSDRTLATVSLVFGGNNGTGADDSVSGRTPSTMG